MIYTLATKDRPERMKARGGFVWETIAEADAYLRETFSHQYRPQYAVYGIEASWDHDTVRLRAEAHGHSFRALREAAPLVPLNRKDARHGG
jgi:hypothetical protein